MTHVPVDIEDALGENLDVLVELLENLDGEKSLKINMTDLNTDPDKEQEFVEFFEGVDRYGLRVIEVTSETLISQEIIEALCQNITRPIELKFHSDITDGMEEEFAGLIENDLLVSLDLDTGSDGSAIARALTNSTVRNMHSFSFFKRDPDPVIMAEMCKGLARVEGLTSVGLELGESCERVLRPLLERSTLERWNLREFGAPSLPFLARMLHPRVTHIALGLVGQLTPVLMEGFMRALPPSVRSLKIEFYQLTTLQQDYMDIIAPVVKQLPRLEELDVSTELIGVEGKFELGDHIKRFTSLNFKALMVLLNDTRSEKRKLPLELVKRLAQAMEYE